MHRLRVIPVLLISKGGLVKSVQFKNHKYVGDPINAVKIFNEKEVDELVVMDIDASFDKRGPNFEAIQEIVSEAFMPVSYGGGITTLSEVETLLQNGVEKVILNHTALNNPSLITQIATTAGSQSVVVCIDHKKNLWGRQKVYGQKGKKNTGLDTLDFAKKCQDLGAGEIILQSIDRDGTYSGYDLDSIKQISKGLNIPLVALGGAGSLQDFSSAVAAGASAVAAGSMFVFQRPHQAVLISYPKQAELKEKVFSKI